VNLAVAHPYNPTILLAAQRLERGVSMGAGAGVVLPSLFGIMRELEPNSVTGDNIREIRICYIAAVVSVVWVDQCKGPWWLWGGYEGYSLTTSTTVTPTRYYGSYKYIKTLHSISVVKL
jgi:hypothetical protein